MEAKCLKYDIHSPKQDAQVTIYKDTSHLNKVSTLVRRKQFSIHCAISFSSKFHNLTRFSFWDTSTVAELRTIVNAQLQAGCLTTNVKLTFIFGWNPFLILQQVGVIFSKYFSSSLYWRTTIFNQHVTTCTRKRRRYFLSNACCNQYSNLRSSRTTDEQDHRELQSLCNRHQGGQYKILAFPAYLQTITQYQTWTSFQSGKIQLSSFIHNTYSCILYCRLGNSGYWNYWDNYLERTKHRYGGEPVNSRDNTTCFYERAAVSLVGHVGSVIGMFVIEEFCYHFPWSDILVHEH